jgi:amino acid adenylation domain-containing protein
MQKDNIQGIYPLSPLQEGFFFHNLNDKSSAAYFVQVSYRLHGNMYPEYVRQALGILSARYDVLRTSFVLEGLKKTYQVVLKERPLGFSFEDIRHRSDKEEYLEQARQKDKQRSFDLTHDPLMRVLLLQTGDREFEVIWSHHHIIMDGWCTGIVIREFSLVYHSLQQGAQPQLPPVTQYREFIKWLDKRDAQASATYWKEYLKGYETRTGIGFHGANKVQGYDNCEIATRIPAAATARLQQLCAKLKVTLNSLLQTTWAILLSRYAGRDDVVFGMVVSLRPREIKGVESMVGLLINTVPVRITMQGEQSFEELVKQVQKNALEAEKHQYFPLAEMQAASGLGQHLLDHVFVLGNYLVSEQVQEMEKDNAQSELSISRGHATAQVNYNFSIYVTSGQEIKICFNYNGFVYPTAFIQQIADNYLSVLDDIAGSPGKLLKDLNLLSGAAQQRLLQAGKGPQRNYPGTIDSIFNEQALLQPSAVAVSGHGRTLTYAELGKQATALALAIQDAVVEKGSYIGVKTGRGVDAVISLLGIAKAGCVYIPVDPDHPNERVQNMLRAVELKMLITTSEYLFDLPDMGATVFALDLQLNADAEQLGACRGSQPTDVAYVIFTSGTTGQPKGIPVRHESIIDRSLYHIEYLKLAAGEAVMQLASVAFDASIIETCMGLLSGGRVVIPSAQARQDPSLLGEWIDREKITVGIFPPAYLKLMNSQRLPSLKHIISTGEAAILKDMLAQAAMRKVHNGYGPTELCIGASFHTIDQARAAEYLTAGSVPIGRPFSNTHLYVLDRFGRLCPEGVPGELCAAGIGVTRGYLGDTLLTAQKITGNPYCDEPGLERLYHTGDLVRWNEQQELIYLGRIDEQVQVRGIRVELREIESALFRHSAINQACVVAQVHDGNTYLAAYITAKEKNISVDELFAHLRSLLPEYMVPSQITVLDKMPVTANGKIDKQQLPAFDPAAVTAYEPPQNEMETLLCRIWQEVLEIGRIGRQDNFFAIGGHSLKATQIVSAIYKNLGVRLDIGEIFSNPRIALLAPVVEAQQGLKFSPIEPTSGLEHVVTPSQRRLWVLHQLGGAAAAYNISGSYELSGNLDVHALQAAFEQVMIKHESLRTAFVLRDEVLRQVINPMDAVEVFEHVFAHKDDLPSLTAALSAHEFNLEEGNLVRIRLLQYGPASFVLCCVMHHIISDGWSVRKLFHELSYAYNHAARLRPLRVQYRDYAAWLANELSNEQLSQSRAYWLANLKDKIEPLQLVTDYPRPPVQTFSGATESMATGADLLQKLRAFAQQREMSVFMVLLAAVKLLLFRHSKQNNITVGSAVSGREHPDVQELIGCFINTVVLSSQLEGTQQVSDLLLQVKQTTLGAYANQLYPFDQLVEEIDAERDLSRSALFDVLVNHQSIELQDEQVSLKDVAITRYDNGIADVSAKFDLEFDFYEHSNELAVHLVYNTDLFKRNTAVSFCRQLLSVLEQFVSGTDKQLWQVSLCGEDESTVPPAYSRGPVHEFDTSSGYSVLFERQALQSGDAIAVEDAAGKLTYAELMQHADAVAGVLGERIAQAGEQFVVAVCTERNRLLPAIAIGIWKAGGIYMPVDPLLPAEPMQYMLTDAGASLVITDVALQGIEIAQQLTASLFAHAGTALRAPRSGARNYDGAYPPVHLRLYRQAQRRHRTRRRHAQPPALKSHRPATGPHQHRCANSHTKLRRISLANVCRPALRR